MEDLEQKKLAYVIDDAPLPRRRIQLSLKSAGFEVQEFETVDAALAHMGVSASDSSSPLQNLPQLIVTDYDTKSSNDGIDLLQALSGKAVGLILQSGHYTMNQEAVSAASSHAIFIQKDSFPDDFSDVARQAMEKAVLAKLAIAPESGGRAAGC